MIEAVIYFLISIALTALFVTAVAFRFRKTGKRLYASHLLIGSASFILVAVCTILLMSFAFSADARDYMSALMPERVYHVIVTMLFFIAVITVRYFILNSAYFYRGREEKGESFLAGYGLCGAFAVALYSVFILVSIVVTLTSEKFVRLDESSKLLFSDGTGISVLEPLSALMNVTLFFGVLTAFMLVTSRFMQKHCEKKYDTAKTVVVFSVFTLLEAITYYVFVFLNRSKYPVALLVSVVSVAVCVLLNAFYYKHKEQTEYNNQFD